VGHRAYGSFATLGCAEARFCNDIAGSERSLQHEREVVCADIADRRLRLAQGLGRDLDGECAIRQANTQGDARLALGAVTASSAALSVAVTFSRAAVNARGRGLGWAA
jgi:hypothetical protein